MHFRLTNDQRTAQVADYETGLPTTELITRYGLAKGTVLRLLEEAGVAMRRQGLSDEMQNKRSCCISQGCQSPQLGSGSARRQRAWRGR